MSTKTNTHTHTTLTHFLAIHAQGFEFKVSRCGSVSCSIHDTFIVLSVSLYFILFLFFQILFIPSLLLKIREQLRVLFCQDFVSKSTT